MTSPAAFSILVADDDPQFLKILEHHLRGWTYPVECVSDKGALLRRLSTRRPSLLLMDVRFGEHDGLEVVRQVLGDHPDLKVAMLTAFGSIDSAIAATRFGALDYLTKPIDLKRLRSIVDLIRETPPAVTPPRAAPSSAVAGPLSRPILGASRAIRDVLSMIERVAPSDATVFVLGESGTGKELVARAVHELSPRNQGPFVALNVAALPRELVESTLFGHAKGAFTGADQMQFGCCEAADKGTLFLDEIGEMEIGLQSKLLRFLQERSFQRVGQSRPVAVDVRIVAATNRDPLEQVRRGQLREDLYYRLNVIPIVSPPLRDRRIDIPLLARKFLDRAVARSGRAAMDFTEAALAELMDQRWPGNVRELENFVDRLALLNPGAAIRAEDVRAQLPAAAAATATATAVAEPEPVMPTLGDECGDALRPIERMEVDAIKGALATCKGNVREAAKRLGLGHATVYRKIKKYSIA